MLFYLDNIFVYIKLEPEAIVCTTKLFISLGCVWIKDMEREKEMEKVDDPMVPNGWIV